MRSTDAHGWETNDNGEVIFYLADRVVLRIGLVNGAEGIGFRLEQNRGPDESVPVQQFFVPRAEAVDLLKRLDLLLYTTNPPSTAH